MQLVRGGEAALSGVKVRVFLGDVKLKENSRITKEHSAKSELA